MSDYLSSYTGQEIDQILANVEKKVNVADIVDDEKLGDSETPASSRLMKNAYATIKSITDFNDNKVLRIDSLDQTINGKKTFAASLLLKAGGSIPSGQKLTITSKATDETDAVNIATLKDHGLSVDDSGGKGIAVTALSTGYLKLDLDFSSVVTAPTNTAVTNLMVSIGEKSYGLPYDNFLQSVYSSEGFVNKLDTSVYNVKMTQLDNAVAARVLVSSYNVDLAATNAAINNRVLSSTYSTKMTQLDTSISGKVDTTTYNAAITSINSAKLDKSIYDGTTAYSNGNSSVPINGNVVIGSFPTPTLGMKLLVSCSFNAASTVDLYEIWICGSKGKATAVFQNSSTTVNFVFSVSGNNVNITASHNNTNYSMAVAYKVLANLA